MAKFPKAKWRGPVPNETPSAMKRPILGLILHVEQGSESGSDSWFHNPGAQASAHFGNPFTGPLDQWVDTNDKAWAEVDGNSRWVSVEHEGFAEKAPAPTATQIENDAQLFAWLHLTEGVPLQITDDVTKPGLGWHGMGGTAWGGHLGCPGSRIKAARAQILTRAKAIVAEATKPAPAPAPAPAPKPPVAPAWFKRTLSYPVPKVAPGPCSRGWLGTYQQGPDVKHVQVKVGVRNPDSKYGRDTRRKVASWQKAHGLTATGVVNKATAIKMGPK